MRARTRWPRLPRSLGAALVGLTLTVSAPALAAPPATPEAELLQADKALEEGRASTKDEERRRRGEDALKHYKAAWQAAPSWRSAAGAADASLLAGSSAAASSWYWVATDKADYSEAYLSWQRDALSRVFEGRAALTLEFAQDPTSLKIDGVPIDHVTRLTRPLALDTGAHTLSGTGVRGDVFNEQVELGAKDVGGRAFHKVQFERILAAGEEDPNGPVTKRRIKPGESSDGGTDVLRIVTIVSTVALASGIAVGGGYLLFGRDNPRGLDSAEGAAVVITELSLIAGGTVIALVSD